MCDSPISSFNMAEKLKSNPKFQERVLMYFDQADRNHDKLLLMSEVLEYAETLKKLTNMEDAKIEPLRDVLREFYGQCGVTEKGAKREDWVELVSISVAKDIERMKNGGKESMLIYKFCRTWFDALDLNKDGVLDKEEFMNYSKCFGREEANSYLFGMADVDKNGTVEWDEYFNLILKFWYEIEEGNIDQMYGGHN